MYALFGNSFLDAFLLFGKPARRNVVVVVVCKIFDIIVLGGGYERWRDAGFSGSGSSSHGRRPGHPPTRVS
jgi:hypothetical protein